jgi:hypothetical protein
MKLSQFALVTLVFGSLAAKANFNTDCKFAYREASVNVMREIESFKEGKQSAVELGTRVGARDLGLKNLRAACYIAEPSENRKCVLLYKEVYQKLQDKIDVIALITGNQEEVDYGILDNANLRLKIKWTDLRCAY